MKIKDENGNVIAEINLEEGFSVTDLINSINKKSTKSCFNNLVEISESGDKKQISFKFNDGEFFYDLPSKTVVKSNGSKVSETALSKTKLNIENKMVKIGYYERDTFWLELANKAEVPWIKTFFRLIDIWANQKHKKGGWIDNRKQKKRCKIHVLNSDKLFFDSIESFSKIAHIQSLSNDDLIKFYDGLLENSLSSILASRSKPSPYNDDAIYLNFKKTKLDSWFFDNCNQRLSENYFEDETLIDHIGGYIACVKNDLRNQFKYVFENYRAAITSSQVKLINKLIEMGYESTRLMDYLYRDVYNQGLDLGFSNRWSDSNGALQLLFDYANMNVEMNKEYEKYPRYLSTLHNITQKNYKIKEDEILNEKFQNVISDMKNSSIEYSDDQYVVVLPKDVKDLINEGQNLSHCVASYYKRMANNETNIVFLRKKNNINQSLITIEIKQNLIVQAKGKNNSEPKEKEKEFIKKYRSYLDRSVALNRD
jgi:hypothetical protein